MKFSSKDKLTIPNPCRQEWHDLSQSHLGKFCSNCQKEVIDFTKFSDKQLIEFFTKTKESTCGRFAPTQLNRPYNYVNPQDKSNNIGKYFLSLILTLGIIEMPKASNITRSVVQIHQNKLKADIICNINKLDSLKYITGIITDNKGEYVSFATIRIFKEGVIGTGVQSDDLGNFKLIIPDSIESFTLQVSCIGYNTEEIILKDNKWPMHVNIVLHVGVVLTDAYLTVGVIVTIKSKRSFWDRLFGR